MPFADSEVPDNLGYAGTPPFGADVYFSQRRRQSTAVLLSYADAAEWVMAG